MPSTINGIGTTYYGKKNAVSYRGFCEGCKRETVLQDYETGHFFCVIFIPLIPLGKKQIVGYCSSCTRHRAMPLSQWKHLKEEAINAGLAELAEKKDDPGTALALLGTLTTFHEQEQALDLAAATQARFRDDVDLQIALGAWYEQEGQAEGANRCFDRAYEIDPKHAGAIRARGLGLLEQGRLDDARGLLMQLAPPSPSYDPAVFFVLGSAYQEQGQLAQAKELFDLIQSHSPEWSKDKGFRKAVRKLEKQMR